MKSNGLGTIVVNEEIGVQSYYSNIFYTKNQVFGKIKAAWEKIEVLNKELEKTTNSSLKSTLIRVKNDLCIEFNQYCIDRQNDIMRELAHSGYDKANGGSVSSKQLAQWSNTFISEVKDKNKKLWEELNQNYHEYGIERMKFWNTLHEEELKDRTDRQLIEQYYGHFRNQNTNEMLVKIKDIYTDLKDTINKKLFDKNIDEEFIDQTWISVEKKYEQHLKKCENQYKTIQNLQLKIINNKDFNDAQSLELELNQQYNIGLEYLKFTTNQIINRFISEGVRISGQPPLEEVETKSVIDNLKDELKEKIDQKFVEQGIEEQFKAITLQLCKEQYEDHLKKGDNIDKTIKQLEQGLALCDNLLFNEYQSFYYSLKHQQKAIDDWKNESVNLINDISKQASIFVHDQNANDLQYEMNQKIENLEVENKNLSEKLDILFSANQEQKETIKDHKETIKDLRLDKEDYKEKIAYLSKDKEELIKDKEELKNNNYKLEEKVCKLEEKIDTKDKSLNLFEKILETFQLSSDDIEKQKQKFEKAKNDEKLKGELKSDIRMIKIGVKENLDDEKIKPFIKKITNEELFQEIKDKILSNPINLDDSGYESEVAVGIMGDDFE
ncbi:MAG: hypothetical protein HQ480_01160 [Candidatus Pelagibacter sp.]|nr:hypothetical protein [Candidatus Pelagibacter sp.]